MILRRVRPKYWGHCMANQWFRMYSEFANDPKVQMMTEAMQRRLVMLFCLQCSNGLETLHETELAFALRITPQELAETKELFLAKGFVDEAWKILKWEKRQFTSDSSTARVRKHRESKKQDDETPCNVSVTDTVTKRNAPEQSRAEAEQTQIQTSSPLPPLPVPQIRKKEGIKNIDFGAAAACCCSLLNRRTLSPTDQAALSTWMLTYDFEKQVKPILFEKVEAYMTKNQGKRPTSLSYFSQTLQEKLCSTH